MPTTTSPERISDKFLRIIVEEEWSASAELLNYDKTLSALLGVIYTAFVNVDRHYAKVTIHEELVQGLAYLCKTQAELMLDPCEFNKKDRDRWMGITSARFVETLHMAYKAKTLDQRDDGLFFGCYNIPKWLLMEFESKNL
jgi:hypothetical protein